MPLRYILLATTLFLFSAYGFANGGPIDGSAFEKTGEIIPVKKSKLQIEQERILFRIDEDYVHVAVNYELVNNSDAAEQVCFSFPVDALINNQDEMLGDGLKKEMQKDLVLDYAIMLNGKYLGFTHSIDNRRVAEGGRDEQRISIRYLSDVTIARKSKAHVAVSYKVKTGYEDSAYSKEFLPVFDKRQFVYTFNAAAGFGNGKAKRLSITIDSSDLIKNSGIIKELKFQGKTISDPQTFNGSIVQLEAKDFDFAKAEPLTFSYSNAAQKLMKEYIKHKVPRDNIRELHSSSNLSWQYSEENAFDGDLSTAWCEGAAGDGVGSWIEFKVKDYNLLLASMVSGYTKNREVYENNGRIAQVAVKQKCAPEREPLLTFEEKSFEELNRNVPFDFSSIFYDLGDAYHVEQECTIRLEIVSVFPGKKHADTCISEIFLLGFPVDSK